VLTGAANDAHPGVAGVQTLSDPATDTILSALVLGPAGSELAAMLAGVRGNDPSPGAAGVAVQAAVRAAGATGAFAREEVAAPVAGAEAPLGLDAARLSDGRVLAAWATPAQHDLFSERSAALP
jgi:hypothetical protein